MVFDFWGIGRRRSLTAGDKNYFVRVSRGKCEYCGKDIIGKGIVPEIHHIVPFASGGSDREHNLIVLCPDCHSMVDQISRETLRLKIAYRLPKKASVQKNIGEETAVRKAASKKAVSAKSATKKTATRKTALKKAVASKSATKKAAPKKTALKSSGTKKAVATKATPKKTALKSSKTKKVVAKRPVTRKR